MLDQRRDRFADLAPTGEVPGVWKASALPRLHRLQHAVIPLEEEALAVGLVDQRQPIPLRPQPGVLLHEFQLVHPHMTRDVGDLRVGHLHESRPAAAGRAALALVVNLLVHAE